MSFAPINADVGRVLVVSGSAGAGKQKGGGGNTFPRVLYVCICAVLGVGCVSNTCFYMCVCRDGCRYTHSQTVFHSTHPTAPIEHLLCYRITLTNTGR